MEIIVLIFLAMAAVLGKVLGDVIGMMYRHRLLAKIRREYTLIPAYELADTLSPLEFEAVCTGAVTKNGVAGQIVSALMSGTATCNTDNSITLHTAAIAHQRIRESICTSTSLSEAARRAKPFVFQQLVHRRWLIANHHTAERIDYRYSIIGLIMVILSIVIGGIGILLIITAKPHEQSQQTVGLVIAATAIVGVIASLAQVSFVRQFRLALLEQSRFARYIMPERRARYQEIYGLYLYMKVSGADTMTPDYTTLDFKGLDKLYPYAVAAGLDKQIVRAIASRIVQ